MVLYKTIFQPAEAEQVIDRSRFIGYVAPAHSREEAEAFIASIKAKHKQATHNVPAYIIGAKGELQWASDDGEPSGTSGPPVLHMLANEGLTNMVIVVTRYFGGIKLGTGGLVRAYTGTAKLVLDAAGICEVLEREQLTFKLDYTYLGKLQNMAAAGSFDITDLGYEDVVRVAAECDVENVNGVEGAITELTSGAVNSANIAHEKIRSKRKITG